MDVKKKSFGFNNARLNALLWPALLVFISTVVRFVFLSQVDNHPFDQWRHYALVENIRMGKGFTLFDGQPYIWYSPLWYYFCALFPRAFLMEYIATLLSSLSPLLVYLLVLRVEGPDERLKAFAAGFIIALSGLHVAFTCHNGQEAAALFLLLVAVLLCSWKPNFWVSGISGLLFGTALALRMNFVFAIFLFLPFVKKRVQIASLLLGAGFPLLLLWFRNDRIVNDYQYLFTWDGLAIKSSEFNFLSTLVVQLAPDIQEGLRKLHEMIMPYPEWIKTPAGVNVSMVLFMGTSVLCTVLSKRLPLVLVLTGTLGYYFLFDKTLSSHFLRMYLVLFPVFSMGVALVAFRKGGGKRSNVVGGLLIVVVTLSSASHLKAQNRTPLGMVLPPSHFLKESHYMVNGTLYHPESLIYRFPGKHFIGMPLNPEGFEDFRKEFPQYQSILIHDFAVQRELIGYLFKSGRYRVHEQGRNSFGRKYTVLKSL